MSTVAGPTTLYPASVPCPNSDCEGIVRWETNACSVCLHAIEPPNVRWAQSETSELDLRYETAMIALRARGAEGVARAFEAATSRSVAIFATSFDYALMLLDERRRHQNYHVGVQGGARIAAPPDDDAMRLLVDAQLFGSAGYGITMAALSLDHLGLPSYGEVFLEFSERMCSTRGSLLSRNSFDFVRENPGGPRALPLGHRSTWRDRERLAVVAAADRLHASTRADEFPAILMEAGPNRELDRFMEVHLYGSWGIDSVVAMRMHDGVVLDRHRSHLAEEIGDRANARGLLWERVP